MFNAYFDLAAAVPGALSNYVKADGQQLLFAAAMPQEVRAQFSVLSSQPLAFRRAKMPHGL